LSAAGSGIAREHADAGVGRSVGFRTVRGQRRRLTRRGGAFQLHHANTRKLATWAGTLEGANGEPSGRRPTRKRKSKPLGTWTPAGHLDEELQAA
jgi:hypothetical protein